MTAPLKTVIVIAGPTAVGKTSVAIQVARRLGTEIISADSRQCYRELNIGVARPSQEELAAVPHHFIASHSIHDKVNAATFEQYALEKAAQLFRTHDAVVMVGGTGLYIKAFCEGLDLMPEVPEAVRYDIVRGYELHGLPWLQEQVQQADPAYYQEGEILNPRRLMRALEVVRATGRSVLDFRTGQKASRPFRTLKIALHLPKEQLHQHINTRVDQMLEQGLLEEVRSLLPDQHLSALQTVGYQELFDYFNGKMGKTEAVDAIKTNTRRYAKRQMTWFRKDESFQWWEPGNRDELMGAVEGLL
ncbi:tRNA (adenosine(37)-N6)-dimethylallyltransferase MiaA [Paraflavisolibacter sp. H34]|uniref:tRNA (adenosine(37)-N6)-dimethylallyltransferase MiaA n=1 Tax=Huijunlia imazamoxiresistens TaxID=3127457 RepID=UPI00301B434C